MVHRATTTAAGDEASDTDDATTPAPGGPDDPTVRGHLRIVVSKRERNCCTDKQDVCHSNFSVDERLCLITSDWHQRADESHGNPPQGNKKLLVVRNKVGRPPGELGVRKSMECDSFSLRCFDTVGWATGRASGL